MSVDRNAMAVALKANHMDDDDLLLALDDMRTLTIDLLDRHSGIMDPELREKLQAHVDRLKPVMNAVFRPIGIASDPFVPRYRGTRIGYRADERGFAVGIFDKDKQLLMKPYLCNFRLEIVDGGAWSDVPAPSISQTQMGPDSIKAEAETLVASLAASWELPNKEPYVGEDGVDSELEELLESLARSEPTLSSSFSG